MSSEPLEIFSGKWKYGHCQGIALDTAHQHIYYSFTTALVKTDLQGNLIGSVVGLMGHLGCIDFNDADGRLYGSLEYKNDVIGRGILNRLGSDATLDDAFYMAIFDVDRIDRMDMDACADGVMTCVYLKDVVEDYHASVECDGRTVAHRFGCSGIDGTTFGPMPGERNGKQYLFVTYGVYGDVTRSDNDDQVILCYDTADWAKYERPLSQSQMHTCGPDAPFRKLFVRTGNTRYGVQNLEYDAFTGNYLMAVYVGEKPQFPNKPMYIVDGSRAPVQDEKGWRLSLLENDSRHESGVCGWDFPLGSTGLYSFGDGRFYVSDDGRDGEEFYTHVRLHRWDGKAPLVRVE